MIISINLDVKESAYDKIMYFLSHLKDDVKIITNYKKRSNLPKSRNINSFDTFLNTLRNRHIKIDKNINLDNEMNDGCLVPKFHLGIHTRV